MRLSGSYTVKVKLIIYLGAKLGWKAFQSVTIIINSIFGVSKHFLQLSKAEIIIIFKKCWSQNYKV